MNSQVCIDANLIVAILVTERFTDAATTLWENWILSETQPVAPLLLHYEVVSVLRRKVYSNQIASEDAHAALGEFRMMDIQWQDSFALTLRAYELAEAFNRPRAYDTHYLALAEHLDCPLWTGDERLYNAVHENFPLIRWLGNYE